ncbi:hypothetical protein O3M35_007894 [Rhynocoris fuscipes]|uniref:Ig-like domain-containing protein n=1 Tax=Rhynocoris fuscipes TaxID=488301 RepID=A0AAW1DCK5_9HEMI
MLIVLLVLMGLVHCWACPTSCICKWKGGKQTVECINKSLITLPSGIDHGTQVLDFAGNNLDRLLRSRFERMGLINLQKIYLSRCRIKHIEESAFKGLTNLVELDLSDNSITSVPTETFHDYPSLMRLALNGNPIRVIKANSFYKLPFLTNLELSKCDTEVIEDNAFEGLTSLEWLKLDNNKLRFIIGNNILPTNLHGIDLHHNPWQCDCKLIDLRQWLLKYNIPHSIEPTCHTPARLKGVEVKNLESQDLACLPDVTPTTLYLEIGEGQNTSLLCRVSSIPEAKVSWWYQGNILQNDSTVAPGLHLYYFVEEGTFDKTSELFIFNANVEDNGTFVCIAENQAGKSHSNYTVRIILKEEPVIGLTVFPYEYFVVISTAVSVIAILGIICVALCFVQCRRQKRRKRKKDRSKVAAMQQQQVTDKTPVVRDSDHITRIGATVQLPKVNGAVIGQEMMAFQTGPGVLVIPNNLKYSAPPPVPSAFPEQNPDLINDANSKEWRPPKEATNEWTGGTLPRRDNFPKHLTADVHLSPGKFIDSDGYPVDYGLPKMPGAFPVMMPPTSFYRTLPHKSRQTVGARFSREAELIDNPPDVRYTAEGYPCAADPFISPPAGYKSDPKDASAQWPESNCDSLRTQSVGAQTSSENEAQPSNHQIREEPPVLTESPDEGYEGEAPDTTDN